MPSEREEQRLRDILSNIARIEAHLQGINRQRFENDPLRQDAVERCLERIAEAARKLGDRHDADYPEVELHKLRQFGSVLRHDYDGIQPALIWNAVRFRLPKLAEMCRDLLTKT